LLVNNKSGGKNVVLSGKNVVLSGKNVVFSFAIYCFI